MTHNIFCAHIRSGREPLAPPSDPHPNPLRSLPDPTARVDSMLSADFIIEAPFTYAYFRIHR